MAATRYGITIENRHTGVVRRLTVSRRIVLTVVILGAVMPMLLVMGAIRKAAWERATLDAEVAALRDENASMRAASGALTSQISSLQHVAARLSDLDPTATERAAMARLPRRFQPDAQGGVSPASARGAVGGPTTSPDPMGVVRQMLAVLERRLETARPRLERRAALARSTPAIWPALGAVTSGFGTRSDPFTASASLHPGLDLDVDLGAPVHVTADGVVREARYHHEYGNLVTVSHGFGIETRYAHLQRFVVGPGASVTRGQLVGHAGSSGRSTGTHLHYEVWIDGRAVNPLHYLVEQPRH